MKHAELWAYPPARTMQNFHENLSSMSVTRSGPALAATFIDDDKTLHNVPNSSGLPHYNNMHTRACAHALTHRTAPHPLAIEIQSS